MKHKLLLASIILMAVTATVRPQLFGQTSRTLSINEAIRFSIKNSKQLKNSKAKIEEATAALKEATQNRLPVVGVTGGYMRLNNPNIDLKVKTGNSGGNGGSESSGKASSALYGIANVSLP